MQIHVAAVHARSGEIYINPAAGLEPGQMRFVLAHLLLHVGLRHHARYAGRDPLLWNMACDYLINNWLLEMDVGEMPRYCLYDKEFKGETAETIYDLMARDPRRYSKLGTLCGIGRGDMLDEPEWWARGDSGTLDEFYRRCMVQGLECHGANHGYLPADLIEQIRALAQPPIPWDVQLAQWFDHYFLPLEKMRSYARASRRQAATPDIPRPALVTPWEPHHQRTFGVVLDTSGSMSRILLAKALGAIASYSLAHDVSQVRVVFCDATAYDQGYMRPEDIAGSVRVRGRGGTVLQPGVDLLEQAQDFPTDGPLLIITDGVCDLPAISHEHAYLLPANNSFPFQWSGDRPRLVRPRGPVFRLGD